MEARFGAMPDGMDAAELRSWRSCGREVGVTAAAGGVGDLEGVASRVARETPQSGIT